MPNDKQQHQHSKETAMPTTPNHDDHDEARLYRVTLVVAIDPLAPWDDPMVQDMQPNEIAVQCVLRGLDYTEGVQLIGAPKVQELRMTLAAPTVTQAVRTDNTLPDDEDSVAEALAAATLATPVGTQAAQPAADTTPKKAAKPAKAKRKKHRKKYAPRKPEVAARLQRVLDTVTQLGTATADEVALLLELSVKHVYRDLYNLHTLKQVSAVKAAGKVRWLANAQDNNNTTKEDSK